MSGSKDIDTATQFGKVVRSAAELREILGEPSKIVKGKVMPALSEHARAFIRRAPFAMAATSDGGGDCDVSPRGDGPGFAVVLDERTIALPERPGNKRADTLGNILENPHIGLIFIVPGIEETLRVNGRATIVRDEWLLDRLTAGDKAPKLAIVVEVEEAYFHCAKAFRRAKLWDSASYAKPGELASFGKVLVDQFGITNCSVEEMDSRIEEGYRTTLY